MNNSPLQVPGETLRGLCALLTRSPHLARIFQARRLLYHPRFSIEMPRVFPPGQLFFIRILLNLSWDDMRSAICLLRPIIGEGPEKFQELVLVMPALCSEIYSTSRDCPGILAADGQDLL
jgi:hypothetical protein